jgi:hypothetical protein
MKYYTKQFSGGYESSPKELVDFLNTNVINSGHIISITRDGSTFTLIYMALKHE